MRLIPEDHNRVLEAVCSHDGISNAALCGKLGMTLFHVRRIVYMLEHQGWIRTQGEDSFIQQKTRVAFPDWMI